MELGSLKKKGRLGRSWQMINGARPTRVYHPAFSKERQQEDDIEELFFSHKDFPDVFFRRIVWMWRFFCTGEGFLVVIVLSKIGLNMRLNWKI